MTTRGFLLTLALLLPSQIALAQCPQGWERRPDMDLYSVWYNGAMSYDPASDQLVLFGGYGSELPATLYYRDGLGWDTVVDWAGPPWRMWHRMVYATDRDRIVIYGGFDWHRLIDDLWELDPATRRWKQMSPLPRPAARWLPAAAYDKARGVMVIFGGTLGFSGTAMQSDELWEWNGDSWLQHTTPGPSPRTYAAMCYVEGLGCLLHGGYTFEEQRALDDTWLWDGTAWTFLCQGPAIYHHQMTYDQDRGVVTAVTGSLPGRGVPMQAWEWDGSWTLAHEGGPDARFVAQVAFDSRRNLTVMVGGYSETSEYSDCWTWSGYSDADINHDGLIDFTDWLIFLDAYASTVQAADLNHDGQVDFTDYLLFIAAYAAC